MLDTVTDTNLRAFIAWVPILASDQHMPDTDTVALVGDKRAIHYWDEKGRLPRLFQKTLGLRPKCTAWDVYLIYPPGVKWGNDPPKPVYWQHQLGALQIHRAWMGKLLRKSCARCSRQSRNQFVSDMRYTNCDGKIFFAQSKMGRLPPEHGVLNDGRWIWSVVAVPGWAPVPAWMRNVAGRGVGDREWPIISTVVLCVSR